MTKRILVTGAGGFIGKNTLPLLLKAGYEIHAVTTQKRLSDAVQWHQINLLDQEKITQCVRSVKPHYLLHLAWNTTPGQYLQASDNLDWVSASLSLCRTFYRSGGERAVFAGSLSEYTGGPEQFTESSPRYPFSLYGVCKSSLFDMLASFCKQENLSFAWGRVFFLYGPHENENRVVPYVIRSLLKGKEALCSDGISKKDYLYVEDMAAAFVHLLNIHETGAYNIGSGQAVPLRDILLKTAALIGRPDLLRLGARPSRSYEPPCMAADITRLQKTGFSPAYDLDAGLNKTVEWWKERIKANG